MSNIVPVAMPIVKSLIDIIGDYQKNKLEQETQYLKFEIDLKLALTKLNSEHIQVTTYLDYAFNERKLLLENLQQAVQTVIASGNVELLKILLATIENIYQKPLPEVKLER